MTICVVGGDGFIGRRIVRRLASEGRNVVSLDLNNSTSFDDLPSVQTVRLDLTCFEDVVNAFAKFKPRTTVNLSYIRSYNRGIPPRMAMRLNILGIDNYFEAARLCNVEHVVYASSVSVHGRQSTYGKSPISETDRTAPVNQYGVHKVFNEYQAEQYRSVHGMTITGIRVANVAGIDKSVGTTDHVRCVVDPALGRKVKLKYADSTRCVIHCDDMADVFVRIASTRKPKHTIYMSGGESLSLRDVATMVKKYIPDAEIEFEHEVGDKINCGAYLFDNSRLTEEFDVRYMPYEQRVQKMIQSARNGDKYG